jgi:hypothetical protein
VGFLARLFQRDGTAMVAPDNLMSDEVEAKLAANNAVLDAAIAANPGALPDFAGMQPAQVEVLMAAQAAQRQAIEGAAGGVDAQGVLLSVQQTGGSDLGGGREVELVVRVDGTELRFRQHMIPMQLEKLREGGAVTVRRDPANPAAAVLVDW